MTTRTRILSGSPSATVGTSLFAATTMDTAVRLQRFVVQEAAEIMGFRVRNVVATLIVLGHVWADRRRAKQR